MINAAQRLHNIKTKARLIAARIWRREGWYPCTGDLERSFILREMDLLAGIPPQPVPAEAIRALSAAEHDRGAK